MLGLGEEKGASVFNQTKDMDLCWVLGNESVYGTIGSAFAWEYLGGL